MKYFITYLLSLFAVAVYAEGEVPFVDLETNMGKIVLELDPKNAPKSVENFLSYANEGFYEGTIFHRVISRFMVQGGGFTETYEKKSTRDSIVNEANNGLENLRGTVAMARTSKPHSASSQFFINVNDNPFLNFRSESKTGWGYAVFGKVVEGMDVVDEIKDVEVGAAGPFKRNVPLSPVVIQKVTVRMATPTPAVEQLDKKVPTTSTVNDTKNNDDSAEDEENIDDSEDEGDDADLADDEGDDADLADDEGDDADLADDEGDDADLADDEGEGDDADLADDEGDDADLADDEGDDADLAEDEGGDADLADDEGDDADLADNEGDDADLADDEGDDADLAEDEGDDADLAEDEAEKPVIAKKTPPPPVKTSKKITSVKPIAVEKVEPPPVVVPKKAVVPPEKKAKAISAPDKPSKADKPEPPPY